MLALVNSCCKHLFLHFIIIFNQVIIIKKYRNFDKSGFFSNFGHKIRFLAKIKKKKKVLNIDIYI